MSAGSGAVAAAEAVVAEHGRKRRLGVVAGQSVVERHHWDPPVPPLGVYAARSGVSPACTSTEILKIQRELTQAERPSVVHLADCRPTTSPPRVHRLSRLILGLAAAGRTSAKTSNG